MQQIFTRSLLFLVMGSWTLGASLAAASSKSPSKRGDHAEASASVPVYIYGGFLVVVEGQIGGTLQHQNFVVDTGTAPSILNLRVARELGLALSAAKVAALGEESSIEAAELPELEVGPLAVRATPFLVADLSATERNWKMPIAGILGLDVLGKMSFRLDYENHLLQFGEVSGDGIAVKFSGQPYLAIAPVRINGRTFRMLVDTGAERLVLFGNKPAAGLIEVAQRGELPGNGVAGAIGVRAVPAVEVDWNGQHFRKDVILVADRQEPLFDGLMSVRALGFRALAFDAESQVLYLQK